MPVKVLILCTGNSCRSQMAEGFLRSLDPGLDVRSAGTAPASRVHPLAVAVMKEIGIDLSGHRPRAVDEFLAEPFDVVVTVCDHARETCPVFSGRVGRTFHLGFDDPAEATGTGEEVLGEFRRVRDEIRARFTRFHAEELRGARH